MLQKARKAAMQVSDASSRWGALPADMVALVVGFYLQELQECSLRDAAQALAALSPNTHWRAVAEWEVRNRCCTVVALPLPQPSRTLRPQPACLPSPPAGPFQGAADIVGPYTPGICPNR